MAAGLKPGPRLLVLLAEKAEFVGLAVASGKLPSAVQLATFLRGLVVPQAAAL